MHQTLCLQAKTDMVLLTITTYTCELKRKIADLTLLCYCRDRDIKKLTLKTKVSTLKTKFSVGCIRTETNKILKSKYFYIQHIFLPYNEPVTLLDL